jgi:hypothetical protein
MSERDILAKSTDFLQSARAQSALHSALCTLQSAQSAISTLHSALCNLHNLQSALCTLHSAICNLQSAQSAICTLQYALHCTIAQSNDITHACIYGRHHDDARLQRVSCMQHVACGDSVHQGTSGLVLKANTYCIHVKGISRQYLRAVLVKYPGVHVSYNITTLT